MRTVVAVRLAFKRRKSLLNVFWCPKNRVDFNKSCWHNYSAAFFLFSGWVIYGSGNAIRLGDRAGVVIGIGRRAYPLAERFTDFRVDGLLHEKPILKIARRGFDCHTWPQG